MLQLHSNLATTTTIVTVLLCIISSVSWLRGSGVNNLMRILHGIMGLLYVSAALLGFAGSGSRTIAPLHVVYTTIWTLLWVFLCRGVGRFVPVRDQARFWTVASILLIVLLHRITLTGR